VTSSHLKHSDERELALSTFAESFPCGIALIDSELRVRWANEAFMKLLDITDLNSVRVLDLVHPDDLHWVADLVTNTLADPELSRSQAAQCAELPVRVRTGGDEWSPMVVAGQVCGLSGWFVATMRPAAERHALNRVITELARGSEVSHIIDALVHLLKSQFKDFEVWVIHDLFDAGVSSWGSTKSVPPRLELLEDLRTSLIDQIYVDCGEWVVPILSSNQESVYGLFVLRPGEVRDPHPYDLHVLAQTRELASLAFSRAKSDHLLRLAATTDHLTGLLNRGTFEISVVRTSAQACNLPLAIAFLDLDDFKIINDCYGHKAGDEVLKAIGGRIRRSVRVGDFAGRLGGDEFAVAAKAVSDVDGLRRRLLDVFSAPIDVGGREILVSGSIGIAVAITEEDAEDVLSRADASMYAVKRAQRTSR
jgi:diguanylate cyclase (GGDEF)-like protein